LKVVYAILSALHHNFMLRLYNFDWSSRGRQARWISAEQIGVVLRGLPPSRWP
jgi:hypothetical protein